MKPIPRRERAIELYEYDPATGKFRWRNRGRARPRDRAGGRLVRGYRQLRIDGECYMEHHVAWLIIHGQWPAQLDHINRDTSDNRIANLREATTAQNRANSKVPITSKSGIKGVRKEKSGRWAARIRVGGKLTHLGCFDTPQEASNAYAHAANRVFGAFADTIS